MEAPKQYGERPPAPAEVFLEQSESWGLRGLGRRARAGPVPGTGPAELSRGHGREPGCGFCRCAPVKTADGSGLTREAGVGLSRRCLGCSSGSPYGWSRLPGDVGLEQACSLNGVC